MSYQYIKTSTEQHAIILTINRPDKLNALNFDTLKEIQHFFENLEFPNSHAGIIITGAGEKAFIAGADITEFITLTPENGNEVAKTGQHIYSLIENCPIPVIGAINGYALGGGCELALACHMRVASENALFGQPEVNLGIIPGYGGSQRLPKLVGKGRAIEIITTARNVKASEALEIGLLNYLVPLEQLIDKCHEIINLIATKPPIQVSIAIQSVLASDTNAGYEVEAKHFADCMRTKDFKEGVDAFLNKRKANFKGE